jgi:hypothetical protein
VANYEDAATLHPEQYANVSLFTQPALLINPVLISAPPVLVLLLILLVPSVLAQPRIRSAAEIEAEADEQVARIKAGARVRNARIEGLKENVKTVTSKAEDGQPLHIGESDVQVPGDTYTSPVPDPVPAKMTRALWQALKLPERVERSGVITPQEISDVLGISLSHARNLIKELPMKTVEGRRGVLYADLIDSLYERRSAENSARAKRLEIALGIRKRTKQAVPVEEVIGETLIESVE